MEKSHTASIKDLEKKLETNIKKGLTSTEAKQRLEKNGKNELPTKKPRPWYVSFLLALIEPLQLILIAAAVISVVAPLIAGQPTEFIDFAVILAIVIIDAILETVQTVKARKSVDALKTISKPTAIVIRDDQQLEIDASDLVRGDIVVLEAGKYVPAELRLIETSDFMIDESILTGESVPVEKTHEKINNTDILAEMKNIAFMSTFTTTGRAIGVVIKTGINTEIGKISESINSNETLETPLEKKLTSFGYLISIVAALVGVLVFIIMFFTVGGDWVLHLMSAITLAIGIIPESLSAVVSITLSMSTKRMVKEHVIVKKLASVETLGEVNVICSDKTGTLTQNKMTVQKVILDNKIMSSEQFLVEAMDSQKDMFLNALVLANDSVTENGSRIGDPTELALVDFAELMGVDEQDERDENERIDEIPFDSERKLMTTVNKIDGKEVVLTKGAIDELLKICDRINFDNKVIPLTKEMKLDILKSALELSQEALRVLGFAYSYQTQDDGDHEEDLIFIGAVGMIDPVRDEAIKTVKHAHDAGIRVVMITGDHPITALAIAKKLNLASSMRQVISSTQLSKMTDKQLTDVIDTVSVFARVNPEHKVRIVNALQSKGYIVSMTGDGVNDAPSLSKADVGVAMGITGTDVAKQAADVILTDDDFWSIIQGVKEGRNVFQKIKRAIVLLMGFNIANVLAIITIILAFGVSPLVATDILFINLIVESCLAIALGMGPLDDSLMLLKPSTEKHGILKGLLYPIIKIAIPMAIISVIAFIIGMYAFDPNWTSTINAFGDTVDASHEKDMFIRPGRTLMFITMTIAPMFFAHTIKLSNWKATNKVKFVLNKPLIYASLIAFGISMFVIFVPSVNNNIFDLMGYTQHDIIIGSETISGWFWTGDKIWILFAGMGLAIIPTIIILIIDATVFAWYHNVITKREDRNKIVEVK